jgi:hypothetical protein
MPQRASFAARLPCAPSPLLIGSAVSTGKPIPLESASASSADRARRSQTLP